MHEPTPGLIASLGCNGRGIAISTALGRALARHVLYGAEAELPLLELAGADADPRQEAADGDIGLVAPGANEIDNGIAGVGRSPGACQGSPRLFLARCAPP